MLNTPDIETRLALFGHRRGRMMGLFSVLVTLGLTVMLFAETIANLAGSDQQSVEIDFFVFWGAAKLATQGLPLDAFDPDRIREAAGIVGGDWMPWAYPPGFLLLLAPLGALSFPMAWAVFTVVSAIAIVLATKPLTGGRMHLLAAAALAPAFVPAFLMGQTSTLWTAGLIAALVALQSGRPVLAGIFIGLLTLKPQLGLLLPFALIAIGAWRAFIAATVTAIIAAAIPTAIFGMDYWAECLTMMKLHGETVRGAIADLTFMVSPYSLLAGLGLPETTAFALQWVLTAACIVAVILVWRAPVAFDAKAATLLTAIPLASPYVWAYETALLAPAALFMLRAGILRLTPFGILLGLAMWLGLVFGMSMEMQTPDIDIHRYYAVPLTLLALATCLSHTLRPERSPAHPSEI